MTSLPRSAAITGRGVLSPLGCDWPSFVAGVRNARTPDAVAYEGSEDVGGLPHHALSDPDAVYADDAKRRVDPISALSIAAARAALEDAGISAAGAGDSARPPLDDVALVMNSDCGPVIAVERYLERLAERGPRASRPAMFIDSLLSMPASRVGIALQLRGSTAVLCGSNPFELALDWLRADREHTVVAGGAEYLSPKSARYLQELSTRAGGELALFGQAGAFLVLEETEHAAARGATAYGWLLGSGSASRPQPPARPWPDGEAAGAWSRAIGEALADADVAGENIDAVVLTAGDDEAEAVEVEAVRAALGHDVAVALRPKRLLGDSLGAALAVSLLALFATDAGERTVLVNSFTWGGGVSSLIVRTAAS